MNFNDIEFKPHRYPETGWGYQGFITLANDFQVSIVKKESEELANKYSCTCFLYAENFNHLKEVLCSSIEEVNVYIKAMESLPKHVEMSNNKGYRLVLIKEEK